jgi:hypothetical protein
MNAMLEHVETSLLRLDCSDSAMASLGIQPENALFSEINLATEPPRGMEKPAWE